MEQYPHQNDKSKLTIVSATHQETAKQVGPVHCCGNLCFQLIVSCHPYNPMAIFTNRCTL